MGGPERRRQWAGYMESVRSDERLTEAQRKKAADVWEEIESLQPDVQLPSSGTDDGEFYFGWNSRERGLDISIKDDGSVTWFFSHHLLGLVVSSEESGPDSYKAFLPTVSRTTREDIAHMEAGCRAWASRLEVEKKCGIAHSEETSAWIAAERERAAR